MGRFLTFFFLFVFLPFAVGNSVFGEVHFVTQPVDHFSFDPNVASLQWKQRFFVDMSNVKNSSSAAIFFGPEMKEMLLTTLQ